MKTPVAKSSVKTSEASTRKLYLAGPMSGYLHLNREAFERYANELRAQEWEVFSPLEHDISRYGEVWVEANDGTSEALAQAKIDFGVKINNLLGVDLNYICLHADAIAMMPGWEKSLGARAEHATAVALGLKIIYLS